VVARERLIGVATRVVGSPRVAIGRRVLDRFNAADGGLLAAGVAYNVVLALIPMGIVASGFAGLVLNDPESRAEMIRTISRFLPPLAGVVDEIVGGLSRASPSLSIIGLLLAAWGTSRLFAALESAIAQINAGGPRRSLVQRTARRLGSIAVLTGIVLVTVLATPVLALAVEISGTGPARPILELFLAVLPPVLGGLALALAYRLIPLPRPTWRAIVPPAVVGAVAVVILTRVFVFLAPRLFGANLVYGTSARSSSV
jgi:uncharacterized BrkB/YihY/UPF0761 family membrane protein